MSELETSKLQTGATPTHISLMLLIGIIYPLLFTLNNLAVSAGIPAIAFTFWQTLGASIILLTIGMVRKELPKWVWQYIKAYLVIGLTGIAAPISLLAWLSTKLPVGVISVIVILSPPITYAIALGLRLERLKALRLVGILFGFGGILLLILPELNLPQSDMVWWLLLALLAPTSFALTNNLAAIIRPPDSPAISFSCGLVSAAAIMLIPAMFVFDHVYIIPDPSLWANLAILGASIITCLMYILFLVLVKAAGPVFFSQFNYVVVIAGLGWGILLKNESYSLNVWFAAVLMLGGVAFLTWSSRQKIIP